MITAGDAEVEVVVAVPADPEAPWSGIRRVLMKRPGDMEPRLAAEYGYDGWECPDCGDDLGSCAGSRAVQLHQQCVCGAEVVGLM